MSAVINALVERYGSVNVEIFVLSLLPRPLADQQETDYLKSQNNSIFKVVRNLVQRRRLPVQYVTVQKWLLKRVKSLDGTISIEVDTIYYEENSDALSNNGQVHLHLLLAQVVGLRKVSYQWKGMPLVVRKGKCVVTEITDDQTRDGRNRKDQKGMPMVVRKERHVATEHKDDQTKNGKEGKDRRRMEKRLQLWKGHGNRLKDDVRVKHARVGSEGGIPPRLV